MAANTRTAQERDLIKIINRHMDRIAFLEFADANARQREANAFIKGVAWGCFSFLGGFLLAWALGHWVL